MQSLKISWSSNDVAPTLKESPHEWPKKSHCHLASPRIVPGLVGALLASGADDQLESMDW
jgi:hypothetical protein